MKLFSFKYRQLQPLQQHCQLRLCAIRQQELFQTIVIERNVLFLIFQLKVDLKFDKFQLIIKTDPVIVFAILLTVFFFAIILILAGYKNEDADFVLPTSRRDISEEEEAEQYIIDTLQSQKEFEGMNLNQVHNLKFNEMGHFDFLEPMNNFYY